MTYEELEIKIKSMTAKEIILAMVDGLKNPVMKVNMKTFGEKEDGVCFGCAATNVICKLGGLDPSEEIVSIFSFTKVSNFNYTKYSRSSFILHDFEKAIDKLRRGNIDGYNQLACYGDFDEIKMTKELPKITNDNYKDPKVLQAYIDLANEQ